VITYSDRFKKLRIITEFAANLSIVVAVVMGVAVWMSRSNSINILHKKVATGFENATLGTQIVLPGIDWSAHKATLVVAISSSCHFCIASSPFYSEITHSSHLAPIVIAMPQETNNAQTFLREHAITPRNVVSVNLSNIQVNATPTLLLVSAKGTVTKAWIGELTESQKKEVIESLDRT